MKCQAEPEEVRPDLVEKTSRREHSKFITFNGQRVGPTSWLVLKLAVGFGGVALMANTAYVLNESCRTVVPVASGLVPPLATATEDHIVRGSQKLVAPTRYIARKRYRLRGGRQFFYPTHAFLQGVDPAVDLVMTPEVGSQARRSVVKHDVKNTGRPEPAGGLTGPKAGVVKGDAAAPVVQSNVDSSKRGEHPPGPVPEQGQQQGEAQQRQQSNQDPPEGHLVREEGTAQTIQQQEKGLGRRQRHRQALSLEDNQLTPTPEIVMYTDVDRHVDSAASGSADVFTSTRGAFSRAGTTSPRAAVVWDELLQAKHSERRCHDLPCWHGNHTNNEHTNFGDEISQIQGAIVVKRPELIQDSVLETSPGNLDFVNNFRSYFSVFTRTLFPRSMYRPEVLQMHLVRKLVPFLQAVRDGDEDAGRYLSSHYAMPEVEVMKPAIWGYESVPTIVALADVFINPMGHVWNKKDYFVPKSCITGDMISRVQTPIPHEFERYGKVFVMTQNWGDAYFHFLVESLSRITVMLDVLLEHPDIKIAVHAPPSISEVHRVYMYQLVELIGVQRERIIFLDKEIHVDIAFLPESTAFHQPNTAMISMLRSVLLKAMYPQTGGIPLPLQHPVILLIVRHTRRGLGNSDEIREALKKHFPTYDVVEFFGRGDILEQLQMFATASLVIAPHGAGLSNIVVSPLHTPVLEIAPPKCSSCYVHLTIKLQHIYGRHIPSDEWGMACNSIYFPNVDEVIKLADDLIVAQKLADAAHPLSGLPRQKTDDVLPPPSHHNWNVSHVKDRPSPDIRISVDGALRRLASDDAYDGNTRRL